MSTLAVIYGLQIAGSVLGFMGQQKADKAQADAEDLNASFFEEQARLTEFETARTLDIFSRESDAVIGGQVTSLARSGVAFAGSAVSSIVQSRLAARKEKSAINAAGATKVKLARMRADQASRTAEALRSSSSSNLLSAGVGLTTNLLTTKKILEG